MKEVYVVAIHKEGEFSMVAMAETEEIRDKVVSAFSSMGRVLYWKAQMVEGKDQ